MDNLQKISVQGVGLVPNVIRYPSMPLRGLAGYFLLVDFPKDLRYIVKGLLEPLPVVLGWIPQGDPLPVITLNVVSDLPFITLNSALTSSVARVQLDVWSHDYEEAIDLKNEIYRRLQLASHNYINKIRLNNETDRSEQPRDGSDNWTIRLSLDFNVQYIRRI